MPLAANHDQVFRPSASIGLYDEPGHLIRRAQQIAVSRFHEIHGRHVTPIQYAILRTLDETRASIR